MARPTDPAALAALRARQAANSRAYRARKAAANVAPPDAPKVRKAPSSEAAVQRAHEQRAAAKERRNLIVGELPSARNPRVKIFTPRADSVAPASIPDTEAKRRQRIRVIRENAKAQQLTGIGRQFKNRLADILDTDPRGESIRKNLSKSQLARFEAAIATMRGASQQTLGIYLQYEGGAGDFESALTQIAYPGQADAEDALGRIESMADNLEKAEGLYGPSAVGRLRI